MGTIAEASTYSSLSPTWLRILRMPSSSMQPDPQVFEAELPLDQQEHLLQQGVDVQASR